MKQTRIAATYMRGGTSKGVFFRAEDLPVERDQRDQLLMRVIGSPDRYGKHIDGMGGATSSTSKVVIVSRSSRSDSDVDYLFGAVAVGEPVIDWSGNCGNLTSAVGPFAIHAGLVDAPSDGVGIVRIWQANIQRRIIAHVPMAGGSVQEIGDFELDGVPFPAAEIPLEFLDLASDGAGDDAGAMFPSGSPVDTLQVPGAGAMEVTLINAGNPTILIHAASLGLTGVELQKDVNDRPELLALAEVVRAQCAVMMGLVGSAAEATAKRPHTPKLAFIAHPASYTASDGKRIDTGDVDLLARIFSMGQLHHAMTGTGAVAIAAAAAIPGTIVHQVAPLDAQGFIRFGHPSGVLRVGAEAMSDGSDWSVRKVTMSRSARRLMEGWVCVPADCGSAGR